MRQCKKSCRAYFYPFYWHLKVFWKCHANFWSALWPHIAVLKLLLPTNAAKQDIFPQYTSQGELSVISWARKQMCISLKGMKCRWIISYLLLLSNCTSPLSKRYPWQREVPSGSKHVPANTSAPLCKRSYRIIWKSQPPTLLSHFP